MLQQGMRDFPGSAVDDDGQTGRLYISPRKWLARLTSKFNSHLAVHHDQVVQSGTNFHAVMHAQPRHLATLSHIPRYNTNRISIGTCCAGSRN